ncbi:ATP-binding cassette domain-containing protein [Clostridium algoriphilum]|uniref:methionine ABC transporter ATP-binding protein n=1 Tax=Clostridium algoriphilum TaxID=198347 RepID=UPI001CF20058|nr:ATP-binding cassette domain-containing protein [Clostridium algoriphilum]MCB2294397.1 ATP-binding cassette domain-containing protein [Clostridium algoriphilum]
MIELQDVCKTFNSKGVIVHALKGINIKIKKGDIFGVIGFSGAGKSTLVRVVNFLEKPTLGKVLIDGKDLALLSNKDLRTVRKQVGMIFQHFNLLNSKTVFDNVAIPLVLSHVPRKQISERVNELLSFVGLESKMQSYPDELSGGEKQRVGIARALATNPFILLCDEATSALDPQTTQSILQLLKRINKKYNITILVITHEMNVIQEICNSVAVMESGEIIEQGNVLEVFGNPKEPTTQNFVRTIIKDTVPKSIVKGMTEEQLNGRIFKIKFIGDRARQPLVSEIAKKFDVNINILFANVSELQGTTLGNIIVLLQGEVLSIEQAYQFICKKDLIVEEVKSNYDD